MNNPQKGSLGAMMMLFEPSGEYTARKPNLNPVIVEQLAMDFGTSPPPEEIFYYIYAVLYSNIYRTMYAEFLKIDFPRIPFTKDYEAFQRMAEYGQRLVELHLLNAPELDIPVARCQGNGDFTVEKVSYFVDEGLVCFNQNQHFEGIAKEVWEYRIGGYQVCDKWLKDRKGRMLSLEDIQHYCKIVTSIGKTIEIQKAIDETYLHLQKGRK